MTTAGGGPAIGGADAAAAGAARSPVSPSTVCFGDAQLRRLVLVGLRRQARRQLQPADILIVGEAGFDRRRRQGSVLSAIETTRVGSLVVASIASVNVRPSGGRDVDDPLVAGGARVRRASRRDRARRGRSSADDDRSRRADPCAAAFDDARRGAVRRDVVADVAVDAEHLLLRRGPWKYAKFGVRVCSVRARRLATSMARL